MMVEEGWEQGSDLIESNVHQIKKDRLAVVIRCLDEMTLMYSPGTWLFIQCVEKIVSDTSSDGVRSTKLVRPIENQLIDELGEHPRYYERVERYDATSDCTTSYYQELHNREVIKRCISRWVWKVRTQRKEEDVKDFSNNNNYEVIFEDSCCSNSMYEDLFCHCLLG